MTYYIVAKRPAMVISKTYQPGECLKTANGRIRQWTTEKQAFRVLRDLQGDGGNVGFIVTCCPEAYK